MYQENNIKIRNNILSFLSFLSLFVFLIVFSFFDITLVFSDYLWSIIVVLYLIYVYFLRYINNVNFIEIYSIFYLTTIFFIFSRFFVVFFGFDQPIFELNFFTYRILDDFEKTRLMTFCLVGLISLELGYYISRILFRKTKVKEYMLYLNDRIVLFILFIYGFFTLFDILNFFKNIGSIGYAEQFALSQTSGYSVSGLTTIGPAILIGFVLLQDNKKFRKLFLILMGISAFTSMLMGSRAYFICFLLFLLWYLNDNGFKKVGVLKITAFVSALIVFLNTIYYMVTFRVIDDIEENGFIYKLGDFFYTQGIQLMVFNEVMYHQDYPIHQYFQNFIPGSTFFYNYFIQEIPYYNKTFVSYVGYELNPSLFQLGFGIGWSFFSDAYLYGLGTPFLFGIFIILFVVLINYLQFNFKKSFFIALILMIIFTRLVFLPRNSLATVFPLIVYVSFIYMFFKMLKNQK